MRLGQESLNALRKVVSLAPPPGDEPPWAVFSSPFYARSGKPTILVVDDEAYITELLSDLLMDELECEVITALNGVTALELVSHYHPSLIITDLMMPRMDGRALIEQLRATEAFRRVPIITMSAVRNQPQWVKDEDHFFLPKPFDADQLLNLMRRLLELDTK